MDNEKNIKTENTNESVFIKEEEKEKPEETKDEFINNLPDWDILPPMIGVERGKDDIL